MKPRNGAGPAGAETPSGAQKVALGKTRKASSRSLSQDQAAVSDEARLEAIAKDFVKLQARAATAILELAECLAKAHEIFRYRRDEGGFGGWVETRLKISRQTAYNVLHVREQFGGDKSVKSVGYIPGNTILYLLAAPSTPTEARDEVIERIESGETVTVAEVKQTIEISKQARSVLDAAVAASPGAVTSEKRKRRSTAEVEAQHFREVVMPSLLSWCTGTAEIPIPHLCEQDIRRFCKELTEAIEALRAFRARLKKQRPSTSSAASSVQCSTALPPSERSD